MGQQHPDLNAAACPLICADALASADETVSLSCRVHDGAILQLTVHDYCYLVNDYDSDPVQVMCAHWRCLKPADLHADAAKGPAPPQGA